MPSIPILSIFYFNDMISKLLKEFIKVFIKAIIPIYSAKYESKCRQFTGTDGNVKRADFHILFSVALFSVTQMDGQTTDYNQTP